MTGDRHFVRSQEMFPICGKTLGSTSGTLDHVTCWDCLALAERCPQSPDESSHHWISARDGSRDQLGHPMFIRVCAYCNISHKDWRESVGQ